MYEENNTIPVVLTNSSVEFVIVGPVKGQDRILLSSENANLDLKGLAADPDADTLEISSLNRFYSNLLSKPYRQLNVIESNPTHDLEGNYDNRKSSFRFAWVGYCSKYQKDKILKAFNRSLFELTEAINHGSKSDIEFTVSPMILECSLSHQSRNNLRDKMRLVIYGYLATIVGAAIYILFGKIY